MKQEKISAVWIVNKAQNKDDAETGRKVTPKHHLILDSDSFYTIHRFIGTYFNKIIFLYTPDILSAVKCVYSG